MADRFMPVALDSVELLNGETPYAIWVFRQYSDTIPFERDEAVRFDGATPMQLVLCVSCRFG